MSCPTPRHAVYEHHVVTGNPCQIVHGLPRGQARQSCSPSVTRSAPTGTLASADAGNLAYSGSNRGSWGPCRRRRPQLESGHLTNCGDVSAALAQNQGKSVSVSFLARPDEPSRILWSGVHSGVGHPHQHSPGPGVGSGTSVIESSSGPPKRRMVAARMRPVSVFRSRKDTHHRLARRPPLVPPGECLPEPSPTHKTPPREPWRPSKGLGAGSVPTKGVEVAGIEPASSRGEPGLLRAQPALSFSRPPCSSPARHGQAQPWKSPDQPPRRQLISKPPVRGQTPDGRLRPG